MNAPNPISSSAAGGDARPYEPSMEEILASIRRIIADDQSLPRAHATEASAPETSASVHVLHAEAEASAPVPEPAPDAAPIPLQTEETAMVSHGTIAAPQFPTPEVPAKAPASPPPPLPAATASSDEDGEDYFDPPHEYDRPAAVAPSDGAPLFSASTNSSVASAFNVLAASRLADNSDELLGMTREMIRPLLRAWLDENLPSMVERLVREEIERVARGGR